MLKFNKNQLILAAVLILAGGSAQAACYVDNFGYRWNIKLTSSTPAADFYSGTMTNSSGTFGGSAIFNKDTNASSIGSNFGTSFHYNLKWSFNGATGTWINQDTGGGNGKVTAFVPCGATATARVADTSDPKPGE